MGLGASHSMLIRYCKITRANSTQRYLPSTFEQSGEQGDVSFVYYSLISVCPSFRLPACFSLSLSLRRRRVSRHPEGFKRAAEKVSPLESVRFRVGPRSSFIGLLSAENDTRRVGVRLPRLCVPM